MAEPVHLSELDDETSAAVREVRSESDLFAESASPEGQQLKELLAEIKALQTEQEMFLQDHSMLRGLAPLYQDYEARFYYFEVVQFVVTLFLVAVAVSLLFLLLHVIQL